MIRTVAAHFHAKRPHSTVTLTMGAANLSSTTAEPYLSCYPIPDLATASDGIFIMSYVRYSRRAAICWPGPCSPLAAGENSLSHPRWCRTCGTTIRFARARTARSAH